MKLVELKVNDYLNLLGSDAPAPGGGSVSAFAGAQGVALMNMVCALTIGKQKYSDFEEICIVAKKKGLEIANELTMAIDKDTEAFNLVSAAFKMPKEADSEKFARSKAIGEAMLVATEVPFKTMELSFQGLKVIETLLGKTNVNAASDLGVGAINLMAAIKGAWLNVMINLPGIKDPDKKTFFETKGTEIIKQAEELVKIIEIEIYKSL
jgi:methenyltetrahydrofolate cyclohydrolase